MGAILAGVVVLVGSNIATRFEIVEVYSPASWVATFVGFERRVFLQDHYWAEECATLTATDGGLAIAAMTVVLTLCVVIVFRRRDILR